MCKDRIRDFIENQIHYTNFILIFCSLFQLWRIFHSTVTSGLPLAVYFFSKVVTRNHDISVISCILVASSAHLWVFGSHTFLNSFLSPFVFLIMGYLIWFIKIQSNERIFENIQIIKNGLESNNNNCVSKGDNNYLHTVNRCNGIHDCATSLEREKNHPLSHYFEKDCFHPCAVFLLGYFSGLFIYIRPDLFTVFVFTLKPYMFSTMTRLKLLLSSVQSYVCVLGCLTAVFTGVLEDFFSYSGLVATPVQWLSFNVFNGYAKRMFGTMPMLYYLKIFWGNYVLMFLLISVVFVNIYTINMSSKEISLLRKTSFTFTCLFSIYSWQGHKEARFLHDTLVLFFIACGVSIYSFVKELSLRVTIFSNTRFSQQTYLCMFLFCFISSQYQSVPNSGDDSVKYWSYEGKTDSHDVNVCLDFIGQQNDVTGVFTDRDIHMTGGYTILSQNVPWFSLINTEFREFSKQSRLRLRSIYGIKEVSITSQISNYVHIHNTQYLLKCLIRQKEYNYLVIKIKRQFITRGYVEAFRYGTMRVLKRSFDSEDETYLETLEKDIFDTKNSTILKYEGQWLMTYGSYNLAEHKLRRAAGINNDLQVHQFLIELFRRRGESKKSRQVFQACKQQFDDVDCMKPARKITLFEHERISLK